MFKMNKAVTKNIIYPFVYWARDIHPHNYLKKYNESQWWSYTDIKNLQDRKLRKLIKHVYNNVPYYHKIFKQNHIYPQDIRTQEDLTKLPLLTKTVIRENQQDMLAVNMPKSHLKTGRTSGTSGNPLVYYRDKNYFSLEEAIDIRSNLWTGCEVGDRIATIWGNPSHTQNQRGISKKILRMLTNNLYIPLPNINADIAENVMHQLKIFDPEIIRGYSKSIYLLAKFASDQSLRYIHPKSIITTAETLYDDEAALIENRFGSKVFREYGSGEIRSIAMECSARMGYHINAEHVIVEFLSENEEVECGSLVITDLDNFGMPFIRYRNGDLGTKSEEPCSCGRELPLIKNVEGRVHDILFAPDGKWVIPSSVVRCVGRIEGVLQYQIIQESLDNLIIKITHNETFTAQDRDYIIDELRQHFGDDMNIQLVSVDEIPVHTSGKCKFIISKVKFNEINSI